MNKFQSIAFFAGYMEKGAAFKEVTLPAKLRQNAQPRPIAPATIDGKPNVKPPVAQKRIIPSPVKTQPMEANGVTGGKIDNNPEVKNAEPPKKAR